MEIRLFQLENLIHSHTRFNFYDLREQFQPLPEGLEQILARAVRLSVTIVEIYLKEQKIAKEAPIILVCEDGRSSKKMASRLEAQGFNNIYVIDGGTEGLASEL